MKKVNLSLMVVLLFMFALASTTWAFQNEPEGFRGLKWGDPPGKDMELIEGYSDPEHYRWRKKEELPSEDFLKGIELGPIEYLFYKGQFMGVHIQISHSDDYKRFQSPLRYRFRLEFGSGWRVESIGIIYTIYGNRTRIDLYEDGALKIYSLKIQNQIIEDKRLKKEAALPEKVISQREIKYDYYVFERFGEYESKLQGKVISDYDERKNKIREIYYDKEGKAQSKITYEYNDKGDEIRRITSVIKNNILKIAEERVYRYKYDEKGNKIEKDYYNSGGHLLEKIVYEYDDEGNEARRICYDGYGNKKWRIIFRYDENNNIEEIEEIYRWEKTLQKYDKDGSSVKNVFSSGGLLYEIFYNPNGKMIEKKQYDPSGKVIRGILCNFDAEGRIVEEVSYRYEEKFGKTQEVPFRKILYEYQSPVELEEIEELEELNRF